MSPYKSIKTYEKRSKNKINNVSKSVDAINALFAQNLTKRLIGRRKKQPKIKIEVLPPRTQEYMSEDSLKVDAEDTFDKLIKGNVYNEVKVAKDFRPLNSSESDASKSRSIQVNVSFHSPIMTRSRRKKNNVIITEVTEASSTEMSVQFHHNNSSTLDKPIAESLYVEKEDKKINLSSLSYIQLPKITEGEAVEQEQLSISKMESSYGPMFSDTFRKKHAVLSSTPCFTKPAEIVADSISPISKSDSSNSSKLIEKSYDVIKKWDSSFPKEDTPKGPVLRSSTRTSRRRKLLTAEQEREDWKLHVLPKVFIKSEDLIDVKQLDPKLNSEPKVFLNCFLDVRGFTESEAIEANEYSNEFRKLRLNTEKKRSESGRSSRNVTASTASYDENNSESSILTNSGSKAEVPPGGARVAEDPPFINLRTRRIQRDIKTDRNKKDVNSINLNETESNKSKYLTVNLSNFEDFVQTYFSENDATTISNDDSLQDGSIISISDGQQSSFKDDGVDFRKPRMMETDTKTYPMNYSTEDLTRDFEICLPKLERRDSTTSAKQKCNLIKKELSETVDDSAEGVVLLGTSRSLDGPLPLKNDSSDGRDTNELSRTSDKSDVIVLSDTSCTSASTSSTPFNGNKTCQNVWHDHSYTSSPMPDFPVRLHSTPKANKQCSMQNTSLMEDQSRISRGNLTDIIESSVKSENNENELIERKEAISKNPLKKKSVTLKPGKSYRRSLSMLRKSSVVVDVVTSEKCNNDCICPKCLFKRRLNHMSRSSQIVPASPKRTFMNQSILENYARSSLSYVRPEDLIDANLDDKFRSLSLDSESTVIRDNTVPVVSAKDVVLRRCGQTEPLPFEECYPRSALQHCQKIGEGLYGEVFLCRNQNGGTSVMKVIPIEGDLIVNGEKQKKFEEIVSEIVIATELSNLRDNKKNSTSGFSEVQKVRCIRGCYPDRLVDLWALYDENYGSENDSPQMFPSDQLYIVLELANGGRDLESFVFNNAQQAFAVFRQTACALAVAESQLKFEHRDLHWGNILVNTVDKQKTISFRLNGKETSVDTHGVEATIIDFTLSRMEFDGVVIFNDLGRDDELFVAKGDYQFEIYRLMQQNNANKWQHFEPFTNVLWLHYILDKAVSALRYKNIRSKVHQEYLAKLRKYKDEILSFQNVIDFVNDKFI